MKRTRGERIFNVFNIVFMLLFAVVCLYPFLYTLTISLSTTADAVKDGFHLFTVNPTLESYKQVLSDDKLFSAYVNTITRTVVGTLSALAVTLTYAYSLSRRELPLRRFFTTVLIITMLFSGGTIPTYLNIKNLGLLDNRLVYILPSLITAYNVIVARSFFASLPEALHESALLDGASEFNIFFRIYIPLSKAVIMTLLLWCAVAHWNAWYDAMIYMRSDDKITVQLLLQRMINTSKTVVAETNTSGMEQTVMPVTIRSATVMVATIPILVVYPYIQKYFMTGVTLGAVKG